MALAVAAVFVGSSFDLSGGEEAVAAETVVAVW